MYLKRIDDKPRTALQRAKDKTDRQTGRQHRLTLNTPGSPSRAGAVDPAPARVVSLPSNLAGKYPSCPQEAFQVRPPTPAAVTEPQTRKDIVLVRRSDRLLPRGSIDSPREDSPQARSPQPFEDTQSFLYLPPPRLQTVDKYFFTRQGVHSSSAKLKQHKETNKRV